MEWISSTADIAGLLGALFSFLAWIQARRVNEKIDQEKKRQNKRITVILSSGKQEVKLPVERRINEIMTGDGDTTLVIPCEEGELEQFDVPRL